MNNYNYQYKRYYQDLQNKNCGRSSSPVYKRSSFDDIYLCESKRKSNKGFFLGMVNIFIYQLVVVVFMLMSVFYLKYSPNKQGYYENIKAVINDTSYSIEGKEVEVFNISKILNEVDNYIKTSLNGGNADF